MKKYFLLSLLIVSISSANNLFNGKYMCNNKQVLEIKAQNLYIGNGMFKYYQDMKRPLVGTIEVFLKGNEAALFSHQPNWKGHYSLNISNLQNKNEAPYVADCIMIQ